MTYSDADPRFAALAHQRRRDTLSCLHRHNVLALADLADELAVREYGTTIDGIPADAVTDVYLSLYHRHVPKLADANLVRYEQDRDLVAITDTGKTAHAWLENEVYEFGDHQSRPHQTCTDDG